MPREIFLTLPRIQIVTERVSSQTPPKLSNQKAKTLASALRYCRYRVSPVIAKYCKRCGDYHPIPRSVLFLQAEAVRIRRLSSSCPHSELSIRLTELNRALDFETILLC